jgi:hypothetical protein
VQDLLDHLVQYWSFLWASARYRIVDSMVSTRFGGDAFLVVASDGLRLRFVRDKGQLFLEVQPPWAAKTAEWHSVDLVYRLIIGQRQESAELSEEYAAFMQARLPEIESMFSSKESFKVTRVKLEELKSLRAKEMFG